MSKKYIITDETLNGIYEIMHSGKTRYASENPYYSRAFKSFPLNDNPEIVMMKISLIDTTNNTNLNRLLGNKVDKNGNVTRVVFDLAQLVGKIVSIKDFDTRVEEGDVSLVSELTKWGQENGLNLMSFFSKYCLYHNYEAYGRDDYSIFDSVVKNNLGRYLSKDEFMKLFPGHKFRKPKSGETDSDVLAKALSKEIEKMRGTCDYGAYHELIGKIIDLKGIDKEKVPFARRKLDHLVWYSNRLG